MFYPSNPSVDSLVELEDISYNIHVSNPVTLVEYHNSYSHCEDSSEAIFLILGEQKLYHLKRRMVSTE